MKTSKWSSYKDEVMTLRMSGVSLPDISKKFGIARSTLSYWFKDIELSDDKKEKIKLSANERLAQSRIKSVAWHRNQKRLRIINAQDEANDVFSRIPKSLEVLELALALLYLGEGTKNNATSMGASDPFMISFFIASLEQLYKIDRNSLRYELHLRDDQNPDQMKQLWAAELHVNLEQFMYYIKDKRTIGKPTRNGYMGVCQVQVGNIAIQRRLKALYTVYCSEVIKGD